MRVKLQLVMCNDQCAEEIVTDVITLDKNHRRIEHLGLTLAEAKQLLSTLQRHLLQQQVDTFLDACTTCPDCGTPLKLKARAHRSFRTLFGTCKLFSPRLEHCDCKRRKTSSFRPLSALLTESVAPELLYMEAKWSCLVSYGMSLDALQDFLPLDLTLDVKTVRYDTLKVAKRLEAELGDEQVLSQSSIFGQNPKIGCQEFNDLQSPKLSKKPLCDRTLGKPKIFLRQERSTELPHSHITERQNMPERVARPSPLYPL